MMHPATELRFVNERIGYGVFARRPIPRGTITWTSDALDQSFTREGIRAMDPAYQAILEKYCFLTREDRYVLCWDIARFVNHSCEATCLAPGYDFELAVRDIGPGEELTDDYGSLNLEHEFECHCGSPRCRGRVRGDDLLRFADEWDERVRRAFALIGLVEQPLWAFVRGKEEIARRVRTGERPPSCRDNYLRPELRSGGTAGQ
jgi:hypothetical protein